jgi:hypothetical protein
MARRIEGESKDLLGIRNFWGYICKNTVAEKRRRNGV